MTTSINQPFQPPETKPQPWYIAVAKPNRDHIAYNNLLKAAINTIFLQYWAITRKYPVTAYLKPYLQPYLFAQAKPHQILAINGISHLICLNGQPYPLPITTLTTIRSIANPAGIIPPAPRPAKIISRGLNRAAHPTKHPEIIPFLTAIDETGKFRLQSSSHPSAWLSPLTQTDSNLPPLQENPVATMGTSIRSKGSINQPDDSARGGRNLAGATSSAKGANHGSFDNVVARANDNSPYALNAKLKRAPESTYSEGDTYSDPHPTDNPRAGL